MNQGRKVLLFLEQIKEGIVGVVEIVLGTCILLRGDEPLLNAAIIANTIATFHTILDLLEDFLNPSLTPFD